MGATSRVRRGADIEAWLQLVPARLPLDDDTTAEVRITGAPISRGHLDALIEYLEVAKRLSDRKRDDGYEAQGHREAATTT